MAEASGSAGSSGPHEERGRKAQHADVVLEVPPSHWRESVVVQPP